MARIAPGVIPIKDSNPYETIRAIAKGEVEMNDILCICGYTGDVAIVCKADARDPSRSRCQLFVARTGAPDCRALWIQPWRIVPKLETLAWPEDPQGLHVFLGEEGGYCFEVKDGMLPRRVGTVVDDGVIHFDFVHIVM